MFFSILTDLVISLHLLFIIFVVAGGFLALWWPKLLFLHLPAVIWGVYVELSGTICPLTPLENYYRQMAGLEGFSGGFIDHYVVPVIYPAGLTHEIQIVLGGFVVFVNFVPYILLVRRWIVRTR